MTAPAARRRVRTCESKIRFADELTARAATMAYLESHRDVPKLFLYPCPHCRGWHRTSKRHQDFYLVTADNLLHVAH